MTTNYIGKSQSRVDGAQKVTGAAKYAAEFNQPNLLYGYVVSSRIAKGRITKIDASQALALPGVVQIFTHENRRSQPWLASKFQDQIAPPGAPLRPLHDSEIKYSGQPIALVVAEDFETARFGAALVNVDYEVAAHETDLNNVREAAYKAPKGKQGFNPPPSPRGDADRAFDEAAFRFEAEYAQPVEHHNPMEMHASTVVYEPDGKLTIYDKTQGVQNSQKYVCQIFGLKTSDVRVISPFVGGAFGSGLRPQYQLYLATMAALELKKSVRVSLTRDQMWTFSHRPNTLQTLQIGAAMNGKIEAIKHDALAATSTFEDHTEVVVNWSGLLYDCANVKLDYKLAKLDLHTPADMRAPGGATGVFALETAIDELAHKLKIDPLELRLKNYSEKDLNADKEFSSKELRECFRQGAQKFGWEKRTPEPGSMRDGDKLIGMGMAAGVWEYHLESSGAKAVLNDCGKLEVSSATADIGTGTYTIMTQIAAETAGLPIADVTFKLGDSSLPQSQVEGGSMTAGAVGSAVKKVCEALNQKVLELAQDLDDRFFLDADLADVIFADGQIKLKSDSSQSINIADVLKLSRTPEIAVETTSRQNPVKQHPYSMYTHSAVFAEVRVDKDFGTIEVLRVVDAVAAGRILNPKTALSQIIGGVVWGIGMALQEESVVDQNLGRFMNHNLAEYHVPVNADVREIDVIFVEEKDESSTVWASKASAKSASSARRRQSATRSFTRPASACAICRLRLINCCRTSTNRVKQASLKKSPSFFRRFRGSTAAEKFASKQAAV